MSKRSISIAAAIGASLSLAAVQAHAAGFFIQEQNAAGVGRAQAGNVVAADDASTIFFNPAGMALLQGAQASIGVDVIIPKASLTDLGSTTRSTGAYLASPASGGFAKANGDNGGNPGSTTPVPDLYLSVPVTPDLTVGIGITAPFGFVSKFNPTSFARYDSLESLVQTADIAPSIAWKVNDIISIGAGLDEQYVHAKLLTALPNPLVPGGPTPASDGALKLTGINWATGFNVGILVQPTPDTKLGATYRSAITHNINGTVTFAGLAGPLAALNGSLTGTTALKLPDIITAGISQKVAPNLTIMGEVDYFGWSKFKQILIHLSNGTPDLSTAENYRNTWSIGGGAEYQIDPRFKLRAGVKWDQTPTVDAFRDTRVPDGNRVWLSAGFNYALTDHLSIDAGYSHIFVKNEPINQTRSFYATAPFPIPTTATILAQSQVKLDILSVGANIRF